MIHPLSPTTSVIQAAPKSCPKDSVTHQSEEKKASPPPTKSEAPLGDRLVRYANYGAGAAGSAAGVLALPQQVQANAPGLIRGAHAAATSLQHLSKSKSILSPVLTPSARMLAGGALKVAKGTESLSKLSMAVMQMPVVGRLTSPAVAKTMTTKVLPVANAAGAGLAIADNSLRLMRAREKGNTTGQVVAGIQVGLNAISGVAGFLPGKAQWVAAGAGLTGLGLEIAHQWGGLGK